MAWLEPAVGWSAVFLAFLSSAVVEPPGVIRCTDLCPALLAVLRRPFSSRRRPSGGDGGVENDCVRSKKLPSSRRRGVGGELAETHPEIPRDDGDRVVDDNEAILRYVLPDES